MREIFSVSILYQRQIAYRLKKKRPIEQTKKLLKLWMCTRATRSLHYETECDWSGGRIRFYYVSDPTIDGRLL